MAKWDQPGICYSPSDTGEGPCWALTSGIISGACLGSVGEGGKCAGHGITAIDRGAPCGELMRKTLHVNPTQPPLRPSVTQTKDLMKSYRCTAEFLFALLIFLHSSFCSWSNFILVSFREMYFWVKSIKTVWTKKFSMLDWFWNVHNWFYTYSSTIFNQIWRHIGNFWGNRKTKTDFLQWQTSHVQR